MKYTVSETVERALQMADLKNTDFLSHKEITGYQCLITVFYTL